MHQDLRCIISENYARQAAGSQVISDDGFTTTPHALFRQLRSYCETMNLNIASEAQVERIAVDISRLVQEIYDALTGHWLRFDMEISTKRPVVITDCVYLFGDTIKILWLNKSAKAFDALIGQLEDAKDCASGLDHLLTGPVAILAKVCVTAQ